MCGRIPDMIGRLDRFISRSAIGCATFAVIFGLAHAAPARALSLCGAKFRGSHWTYNSLFTGYTLHVEMTACGRATAWANPKAVFNDAVASASGRPQGKGSTWDPNPGSMFEQFECHARGLPAVVKGTWNLDSWRPQVSWVTEIRERCNPAPPIVDPTPTPAPAPSPLPTLPVPQVQPLEPLPTIPVPAPTYSETSGPGPVHTWTNYTNAGGVEGPSIPDNSTVQIACKIEGFRVADGNTWWYLIASAPWSGAYYASADAFYNNGATAGSLKGTPFVDGNVANC
jgi:Protein of unknown function (DUF2599)